MDVTIEPAAGSRPRPTAARRLWDRACVAGVPPTPGGLGFGRAVGHRDADRYPYGGRAEREADQVFTTDNQVISGRDIRGYVRIRARNVTIKNSIIRGGAKKCHAAVVFVEGGRSATIQDSEISPSQPNACLDGIWATNATLLRLNIHGAVERREGVRQCDAAGLVHPRPELVCQRPEPGRRADPETGAARLTDESARRTSLPPSMPTLFGALASH